MIKHVIIGQGVAGISSVEAIRTVDRSSEIFLVSSEPEGFYSRRIKHSRYPCRN